MTNEVPPGRIPEEPRVVKDGVFHDVANKIAGWIDSSAKTQGLRIAAIWGGRGSGKTSMLVTILEILRSSSYGKIKLPAHQNGDKNNTCLLFEPSKVVNGDKVIFHLLQFLRARYFNGVENNSPFQATLALVAKAADRDRFLEYEKEIATSPKDLYERAVQFHTDLGSSSSTIRENIRQALDPITRDKILLLFIDDLDLQPHHAYELLQLLHTYFGDVNMVAVLAADREQLLLSVDRGLQQAQGTQSPGLAAQLLAKFIAAEWRLPTPSTDEKRRELLAPGGGLFSMWWDSFVPPKRARDKVEMKSRRSESNAADDDFAPDDNERQRAESRKLFIDASPPTWRGLNRIYNRALTLHELHSGVEGLNSRYHTQVGSDKGNVAAFISILLAFDECFPELLIFEAFEAQADVFREGLSLPPRTTPDETRQYPVQDRLREPTIIAGQRLGQAKRLLRRLGDMWNEVWRDSASDRGEVTHFLAISVQDDASERSRSWWTNMFTVDVVVSIDLRSKVSGRRPSAKDVQNLCKELSTSYESALARDHQQIFAMAPLSLAAWIGWTTRYRAGLELLGYDRNTLEFRVFSTVAPEERSKGTTEPSELLSIIEIPGDPSAGTARDAAVLLDVGPRPDRAQVPLPFHHETGEPVRVSSYIKLVSEPEFRLENDNDAHQIVHEVESLLARLRDEYSIQRIHIAFKCPSALAILIGRVLHSWTPVLLYEYSPAAAENASAEPRYDYVITLG